MPITPSNGRAPAPSQTSSSDWDYAMTPAERRAALGPVPPVLDLRGVDLNPDFFDNLHYRLALLQERNIAALESVGDCIPEDPIKALTAKVELLTKFVALRRAMHEERLAWTRLWKKKKR